MAWGGENTIFHKKKFVNGRRAFPVRDPSLARISFRADNENTAKEFKCVFTKRHKTKKLKKVQCGRKNTEERLHHFSQNFTISTPPVICPLS
jgi:hypothetical protein